MNGKKDEMGPVWCAFRKTTGATYHGRHGCFFTSKHNLAASLRWSVRYIRDENRKLTPEVLEEYYDIVEYEVVES